MKPVRDQIIAVATACSLFAGVCAGFWIGRTKAPRFTVPPNAHLVLKLDNETGRTWTLGRTGNIYVWKGVVDDPYDLATNLARVGD